MDTFCATGIRFEDTALARFLRAYGYVDLAELTAVAAEEPQRFWAEVEDALGLRWATRYRSIFERGDGRTPDRWFVDGQLDLYDQLVGRTATDDPGRSALAWESDDGATREITSAELDDEARRLARALADLGIRRGDRVAVYLPAIPEFAVVMLATTRLGAVAVPLSARYRADAVASRLADSGARLLVCADGYLGGGKRIDMLAEGRAAAAQCGGLEALVVVPRLHGVAPPEPIFASWRERDYRILLDHSERHEERAVFPADTPLMILYTSARTGCPRAVVHTHAGFPVKAAQDMLMAFDVDRCDRLMWVTEVGRPLGPWLLFGGLLRGATVVMHEGMRGSPAAGRLWRIAERQRLTHLGLSPQLARSLMDVGAAALPPSRALDSLRIFGSAGQAWNARAWRWLFREVGRERLPIVHFLGAAEAGGSVLTNLPGLPQKPGGFLAPALGLSADVVDGGRRPGSGRAGFPERPAGPPRSIPPRESGCHRVGELVLRAPWPGKARAYWHDDEPSVAAVTADAPQPWRSGHWGRVDADGHWFIHGCSEETLEVAGQRVALAEYEFALEEHPFVADAVAIAVPEGDAGTEVVCFATLEAGRRNPNPSGAERMLWGHLAARLGVSLAAAAVHVVTALPRADDPRVLRRAVRAAYLELPVEDVARLERAEALETVAACRPVAADA